MEAMHKARQNFVQAESSEKIQRALHHKVRSYADVKYSDGDKVFYQRKNFKGWKGPGVVLGQDGQFVLIKRGGAYYRVHPCQLMKEKVTSQAMHKQEHVKKGFCKGSSSSHSVDETKDSDVITLEGDEQDDIPDSGHVESNLSECADNEDNATQGVASEKDVENNVVQDVTPEYNTVLKPKKIHLLSFSQWKVVNGSMQKYSVYNRSKLGSMVNG